MKKEVMELWTTALESGEFQQATGALTLIDSLNGDTLGHCCLGVLCEVAIREGVKVERTGGVKTNDCDPDDDLYDPWENYYTQVEYDTAEAFLPPVVQHWAGIGSINGQLPNGVDLASLNDQGNTFSVIAEIIRTNYEAL